MPRPGGLLALVSIVVLVDTIFFAAVVPLLPAYAQTLDLGKTGAGVLEASYGAGTLISAVPAGVLAARVGVKRTVLVGLALLGVSSLVFGLAQSVVLLDVARFAQGVGGACSWAGALGWLVRMTPVHRRGEFIGTAMGAAIVGALLGPAVGALAAVVGTGLVFGGAAVLAAGVAAWALRFPAPPPGGAVRVAALTAALRDRRVAGGMFFVVLPGLFFAGIGVLGPLRLDELGATSLAIGATFLVAAGFEAATSPIVGRLSDRRGRLAPMRIGLLAAAPLLALLPHPGEPWLVALVIVAVSPAIGACWAPAMALLTDGTDAHGLDPAIAFAPMNAAWGVGHVLGGVGAGAIGDAAGDIAAFTVLAAICLGAAAFPLRTRIGGAAGASASAPMLPR